MAARAHGRLVPANRGSDRAKCYAGRMQAGASGCNQHEEGLWRESYYWCLSTLWAGEAHSLGLKTKPPSFSRRAVACLCEIQSPTQTFGAIDIRRAGRESAFRCPLMLFLKKKC